MKIGYLVQQHIDIRTPPFNGPANHVREIIENLQKLGHDVRVLVNMDGAYFRSDDLQIFIPVSVPWLDKGPLRWMEKFIRRIQSELHLPYFGFFESIRFAMICRRVFKGFDLFYERMSWMLFGGALASKQMKIPLFLENNGDLVGDLEAKGMAPTGMQRRISFKNTDWTISKAVHIIISGDGWRQLFIKRWGIAEEKITTIENGTVLVEILQRNQLRSFLELPPREAPQFVYLGNFHPWQGVPQLIYAFRTLVEQSIPALLLLIGSGHGKEEAEQMVSEFGMTNHVTFTGQLRPEEYARLLADSDVGLVPYCGRPEYSGLKTFDYKAAGLPVISTGENGMPVTLSNGRTALIIPPCDENALAEAMMQLAVETNTRLQMGQAARIEAEAEHTWEHTAQNLLTLFQQILNELSNKVANTSNVRKIR